MDVTSVAEQLLFSTVRIESIDENGIREVGTGLIFSFKSEEQENTVTDYIVTCKHVVEKGVSGCITFLTGNGENEAALGKTVRFTINNNFKDFWIGNSNENIDVAIFPLNELFHFFTQKGILIFCRKIENTLIPNQNTLQEIDALEEVLFIGYPWGLWDKVNNLPIFRKGITASPITIDFEGDKKFLIDASVFPGSSGSPVFLFNNGPYSVKSGLMNFGSKRLILLGIISETYSREIEGKMEYYSKKTRRNEKEEKIPVPITNQYLNIGIVFKSITIVETIQEFLPNYQEYRKKNLAIGFKLEVK